MSEYSKYIGYNEIVKARNRELLEATKERDQLRRAREKACEYLATQTEVGAYDTADGWLQFFKEEEE